MNLVLQESSNHQKPLINKGFTEQYQKLPAKSGDKPIIKSVLLLQKQLEDHNEILVNEVSSEDSESEKNSEYQNSDNESY